MEMEWLMDHCFICLNKVSSSNRKHDTTCLLSLQPLYRYLGMVTEKAVHRQDLKQSNLPQQQNKRGPKEQQPRLKVELCQKCAGLLARFSELDKQLEKVKLEMQFCFDRIHGKLSGTKETCRDEDRRQFTGPTEIFFGGRMNVAQKCAEKLKTFKPRVKIQGLKGGVPELKLSNQEDDMRHIPDIRSPLTGRRTCFCGKQFKYYSGYYHHTQTVHQGIRFRCVVCNKSFTRKDTLANHKKGNNCSKVFAIKNQKYRAITPPSSAPRNRQPYYYPTIVDSTTGTHKCSVCSERFKSYGGFKTHYKSAHLKVTYTCSECQMEFPRRFNYLRHCRDVHLTKKETKLRCQACGTGVSRKEHLIRHQRLCNAYLAGKSQLECQEEERYNREVKEEGVDIEPFSESEVLQQMEIEVGEVKLESHFSDRQE